MKEIFSLTAIILTIAGFYPYLISVSRGITKPHVFSWVIWGLTTLIAFFAQLADQGGVGAWPTGVSAVITFYVAWVAFIRRADIRIVMTDWVYFVMALGAIPVWYFTSDPLWAVIILTSIDILGSFPTFRKVHHDPESEDLLFYIIIGIRSAVSILALEHYSWTTILFPAAIAVMCAVLAGMILMGKHRFPKRD